VMRPKDSLDFRSVQGDAIFFGDETSLAAAQALQGCFGKAVVVLEVESAEAVQVVASRLGLGRLELIERQPNGYHLDTVVAELMEQAAALRSPQWVFTGQARSIQTVQKLLKAKGVALAGSKVRAYWSPGKTGMD
jgi:ferric-chelate reductase (NADPH)